MTEPRDEPWDDDRLEASFVALDQTRSPSAFLIEPTLARISSDRRPPPVRWVMHPVMAMVAIVAVIAIVGSLSLATQRSPVGRPTVTDAPGPVATVSAPTAASTNGPMTLGLSIVGVSDAIAVRDGGFDDHEIAVRGWFRPVPSMFACPLLLKRVRPVQFGCGDQFEWLTQDPIPFGSTTDANGTSLPPKGPAIHPSFDLLGRDWQTSIPPPSGRCGLRPSCPPDLGAVSMIAIGHFDDRRAAMCDANARVQCQDRFVVDRIDYIDDQLQRLSLVDEAGRDRIWTVEDIDRLDPLGPEDRRLSVQVLRGGEASLTLEPVPVPDERPIQPAVWVIRDLIGDHAVTRTIVDGSSEVDEIRPDGSTVVLVSALSSDPGWPPPAAIIVARSPTEHPRQFVAVVDQTGHLVDATRTSVDNLPDRDMAQRTVWADAASPTRIVVRWGGSICDERLVLTIRRGTAGRPDGLFLDGERNGPCRLVLVTWAISLRFDSSVAPGDLFTQYGIEGPP